MKLKKLPLLLSAVVMAGLVAAGLDELFRLSAQSARQPLAVADSTPLVERGRYLTERVAMCIQCHTPRDDQGELLLDKKFEGAPMPLQGPHGEWAIEAPRIAGLAPYSRAEALKLLTEASPATVSSRGPPCRLSV